MRAQVPKYKMITISILSDRLRINCSLARRAIALCLEKGLIRAVATHARQARRRRAAPRALETRVLQR